VRVERSLHLEFAVRIGVVMDARFMVGEADSGRAEGTYDPRGDADGSEDESCGRHFVVFGDVGVQRQIREDEEKGAALVGSCLGSKGRDLRRKRSTSFWNHHRTSSSELCNPAF
jgi:hypothetical protein